MAVPLQYKEVDATTDKLSKIQEFIDVGYTSTLEIALDIEEGNTEEQNTEEIEKLKQLTMSYAEMELELGTWLKAAALTKKAFLQKYKRGDEEEIPDIEEIMMSKLSEVEDGVDRNVQQHAKVQHFRQEIWNVHHEGEPLPTMDDGNDQDEDIVIAQAPAKSLICPLTRQQMKEPVKNKKCNHSYEKAAIIQHIKQRRSGARCPVAGCAHYVNEKDLEVNADLAFRLKRLNRKK